MWEQTPPAAKNNLKTQSVVELPKPVTKCTMIVQSWIEEAIRCAVCVTKVRNFQPLRDTKELLTPAMVWSYHSLKSRLNFFQYIFPSLLCNFFKIIIIITYPRDDVLWIPLCQIQRWFKVVLSGSITLANLYILAANHNWLTTTRNNTHSS